MQKFNLYKLYLNLGYGELNSIYSLSTEMYEYITSYKNKKYLTECIILHELSGKHSEIEVSLEELLTNSIRLDSTDSEIIIGYNPFTDFTFMDSDSIVGFFKKLMRDEEKSEDVLLNKLVLDKYSTTSIKEQFIVKFNCTFGKDMEITSTEYLEFTKESYLKLLFLDFVTDINYLEILYEIFNKVPNYPDDYYLEYLNYDLKYQDSSGNITDIKSLNYSNSDKLVLSRLNKLYEEHGCINVFSSTLSDTYDLLSIENKECLVEFVISDFKRACELYSDMCVVNTYSCSRFVPEISIYSTPHLIDIDRNTKKVLIKGEPTFDSLPYSLETLFEKLNDEERELVLINALINELEIK